MKIKILSFLLFIFCFNTSFAQNLNYGFCSGFNVLSYKNVTGFNSAPFTFGICPQLVLKDSSFGFELDASLYADGTDVGYPSNAGYSIAPYFFVNTDKAAVISAVVFRGGFTIAHLNSLNNEPSIDYGPSLGVYLYFKLAPTFYLAPDFSLTFYQKFYTLQEPSSLGGPTNPIFSSHLTSYNFTIKILFR